jgi:hypothetical protein
LYRHILSDESSEYLDERGNQPLDRCCHCYDAMRLDTPDHAVPLNAVVADAANALQHGMFRFCSRERPREQRVTSIFAHGIAQTVRHPYARPLQRGTNRLRVTRSSGSRVTCHEAASDCQR